MIELALRGPKGEPVDFFRLIHGHGLSTLPPLHVDSDRRRFSATLPVAGRAPVTAAVQLGRPGFLAIDLNDESLSETQRAQVVRDLRHILRFDEDLSAFYALAAADPDLRVAVNGGGRMTRCLTVFEDVVKTILTTNCAWSATIRMTTALVDELGVPVEHASEDGTFRKTFPTAEAMATRDETFYREVIRAGYRARYLAELSRIVAAGEIDLEALGRASIDELSDDDLAKQLQALPGIGPYAAAHVMMMLGRYSRCIFDSWSRPAYAARAGAGKVPDAEISARFAPYGRFAGLAFWLYITEPRLETSESATS